MYKNIKIINRDNILFNRNKLIKIISKKHNTKFSHLIIFMNKGRPYYRFKSERKKYECDLINSIVEFKIKEKLTLDWEVEVLNGVKDCRFNSIIVKKKLIDEIVIDNITIRKLININVNYDILILSVKNHVDFTPIKIHICKSNYPSCLIIGDTKIKWVKLHKLIGDFKMGGRIPVGYSIHHKNKNILDNTLGNLEILKNKTHKRIHELETLK